MSEAIKIGDTCPTFQLYNQNRDLIDLNAFIGVQTLVIFFYPKDETPGCTKEVCTFRDNMDAFIEAGAAVFGISSDTVDKHEQFHQKFNLNFHLLSDQKQEVRKTFGVPSNLFGLIPGRVTYIIDKSGKVRGVFNSQTNPAKHVAEALNCLKEIAS
jgi:peroxiredoxin Q/BCP